MLPHSVRAAKRTLVLFLLLIGFRKDIYARLINLAESCMVSEVRVFGRALQPLRYGLPNLNLGDEKSP